MDSPILRAVAVNWDAACSLVQFCWSPPDGPDWEVVFAGVPTHHSPSQSNLTCSSQKEALEMCAHFYSAEIFSEEGVGNMVCDRVLACKGLIRYWWHEVALLCLHSLCCTGVMNLLWRWLQAAGGSGGWRLWAWNCGWVTSLAALVKGYWPQLYHWSFILYRECRVVAVWF